MPNLYIIAGPNGAGKTTIALSAVRAFGCKEFVNADLIASGLSPLAPEKSAIHAGRIMLERLDTLIKANATFAFETTLASRHLVNLIKLARKQGYEINLIFVRLENAELALKRVKLRVSKGGHNIEPKVIKRRFKRGLENFFSLYSDIANNWVLLDNSETPIIVAESNNKILKIHKEEIWRKLKSKK